MFADHITGYLKTLNNPLTIISYSRALQDFHNWYRATYAEEPSVPLLTDVEVREWKNYLSTTRQFGAATVNQYLAAIRSLVRHCGGNLQVKGMKKVIQPISPLNGRELGRLLAATDGINWLSKRNNAMIELMARAGLRVSEIVALQIRDVTVSQRKGEVLVRHGKGMKERSVPLGRQVRQALEAYLSVRPAEIDSWFFVSRSHKRLAPRDLQRMVTKVAYQAGLRQRVTPHLLRHTFATRALRNGVDIATLSRLLGHENLTTTARYLHPDMTTVAAMVEEL